MLAVATDGAPSAIIITLTHNEDSSSWAVSTTCRGPRIVVGCVKHKPKEQQEGIFERGYFVNSEDKFATAGSSGDTAFMIKLAQGSGQFCSAGHVTLAHLKGAKAYW